MSASERFLHNIFNQIVADRHPFTVYEGYAEGEDGFIVYYQDAKEEQQMIVDIDGNILDDSTVSTTRILSIFAIVRAFVSQALGGESD